MEKLMYMMMIEKSKTYNKMTKNLQIRTAGYGRICNLQISRFTDCKAGK
jgi:hypothetical protein